MTSQKFTQTITTYNQHASKFAEHFERKLDSAQHTEFLASLPAGATVLDAGCGSATSAAHMMSLGFQAEGIDVSEGLLAEAQQLHPEVPTHLMSLTEISLPNESFDGVWCKAALLHVDRSDVPKVLEGFWRILKPGGVLFLQTKEGVGEGDGEEEIKHIYSQVLH